MDTILTLWSELNWLLVVAIFIAYIVIDGLFAVYTLAVTNLKPARAATAGSITYIILAIGVISYVNNFLYVAPMVFGLWVGTYMVVSWRKNVKLKKKHV